MSAEKKQSRQTEKRKYRKCLLGKSSQGRQKRGNTENVCRKKQSRQTEKRKYRKCLPEKRPVKAGKQGGCNGIRL